MRNELIEKLSDENLEQVDTDERIAKIDGRCSIVDNAGQAEEVQHFEGFGIQDASDGSWVTASWPEHGAWSASTIARRGFKTAEQAENYYLQMLDCRATSARKKKALRNHIAVSRRTPAQLVTRRLIGV